MMSNKRVAAMARTLRDTRLETAEARRKLAARGKPYWRLIEEGVHLGYRRLKGRAGTWVSRHYRGDQQYVTDKIGIADDNSNADGDTILSFKQAQDKARGRPISKSGPFTVDDAMAAYLEFMENNRKSAADARCRYELHIKPTLGEVEVAQITAGRIRKWLANLAKSPAMVRTKEGDEQNHREPKKDGDDIRRRKASANRVLTTLKAALNMAWRENLTPTNAEWGRVEPFENVDVARVRYLDMAECKRLINACDPDFRLLVQGALQTGARYGELIRLVVSDFNRDSGTVAIRESKAGKPRHVVLTDEGVRLFNQLCAGRAGNSPMFARASGATWKKSDQARPMIRACEIAKIEPAGFHALRHTWASLAVMNGVPLMIVARNLGHADTRMVEKHYGHLAPDYIKEAIRKGAPRFGFKPDKKIAQLSG
jgi:integrase